MSDGDKGKRDDASALDEVSEEEVEHLEENVDMGDLDEDELVSVDVAARSLLAKPRRGHGPIARLYRGETRFDFVGRRKIWFAISTLIIVLGIVSIILRGGLNLGIEFKGGTEWTIAAPGISQTQATDAVKGTGVIDPTIQLLGTGKNQTLNVQSDINRLSQSQQDAVNTRVQKALLELTAPPHESHGSTASTTTTAASSTTTTTTAPQDAALKSETDKISITTVGPTWGSSITDKAIQALIIFFIVVAIYISFRFEPKMALAAFIAMIHDVLVAIGIYSIFNFQVTPDTVVAILTILGYSLYDTVVVFDRVRDNTRGIGSTGRLTYPQLINLSMNQTLARSINTSMVAILPVLAVLLIGAQVLGATTLQSYGLALFVGLLSGAYSSIFIASPVLSMMKEREDRWVAVARRLDQRGEGHTSYSALDAATMSTQMSVAASGQAARSGAGVRQPHRSPGAPSAAGPFGRVRGAAPGVGAVAVVAPGVAVGAAAGTGTGTVVMDRPAGSSPASPTAAPSSGSSSDAAAVAVAAAAGAAAARAPRPRKHKKKRRR